MDREKLFRYLDERYSSKRDMISRIPLGVHPETLWQELLNRRRSHSTILPLYDRNGKPYWYVTTNKMVAASEKIVDALFENETEFDLYAQGPPVMTLEEVFYTSYVEGAQITLPAAMDFLTGDIPPRDIEEQIIANNRMAGSYAADNLYRPVDIDLLRDLAYILTEGMDNGGGDFRSYTGTDYISDDGEELFFPPPSAIPELMHTLCVFLGDAGTHPLVKAGVAQAYILVVRPFPEGNERLSRILSSMILLRSGYTFFSDISLSALMARRSYAYYEASANILSEESGGDMTYFIEYFLELLSRAVDERRLRSQRRDEETRQAEKEMARTALTGSFPIEPAEIAAVSGDNGVPATENATDTDLPLDRDDRLEDFFTVTSEGSDSSSAEMNSNSIARVRDKLYEIVSGNSVVMKQCAKILLDILDSGRDTFTADDIRIGCDVTMKRANSLICHMREKGLLESTDERQSGLMIYRFGTCLEPLMPDDYAPEIIDSVKTLIGSKRSPRDQRIGELISSCLSEGVILPSDYERVGDISMMPSDMELLVQMGLVVQTGDNIYRINKKFEGLPELSPMEKVALNDLYNRFKDEWFSRKSAMEVLQKSRSWVGHILRQFVMLRLMERSEDFEHLYHITVSPGKQPSLFDQTAEVKRKAPAEKMYPPLNEEYINEGRYSKEVFDMINTLAASENSSKDQRLAEVMRMSLRKGKLTREDYKEWGYSDRLWHYDTDLAFHLGLIRKESSSVYLLNAELQPKLRRAHKKTITAIYEAFGFERFSSEMFIATLNYSSSYTYTALHKLTLLKILDQKINKEGNHYRLIISPEDHPECFDLAA